MSRAPRDRMPRGWRVYLLMCSVASSALMGIAGYLVGSAPTHAGLMQPGQFISHQVEAPASLRAEDIQSGTWVNYHPTSAP